MLKIPFPDIIEKIKESSKLSEEDINNKIKQKMEQLSGLISKEGAAHIIANELGIKIFDQITGKLEIKNILTGMRDVETVGVVQQIFNVTVFQKNDRSGKVFSFIISDATDSIRVVAWNDMVDKVVSIKEGDVIKIKSAYVRENNNRKELHLNAKSVAVINPEGEKVENAKSSSPIRKKIQELTEKDDNIELLGTIVQVFEPRFFEICPQCNRRAKPEDGKFNCVVHGAVDPKYSYVMNLSLDDGSDNIRVVCFKNQASKLLGKTDEEMQLYRENPAKFDEIKNDMLGNIVKLVGRVTKNEMFDRLEFISQMVFTDPNPEEEIKRMNQETAKVQEN